MLSIIITFCVIVSLSYTSSAQTMPDPDKGEFVLPELGYSYDALEPFIDSITVRIHYSKHHLGYVNKLNSALKDNPLKGKSLEEILATVDRKDENKAILNNAGGVYNHILYWQNLKPGGAKAPKGNLSKAIVKKFGGFDKFQSEFAKAGNNLFGSGWVWLIVDANKNLVITTTSNQDCPLMKNAVSNSGTPILAMDVWEHAYYLKYQNKRADYITNFGKAINWDVVSQNYEKAMH